MSEPSQMRFWIGGFRAPEYELIYDGIRLQYRRFRMFDPNMPDVKESVPVETSDWEAFARELDMIGVWDWKPRYEADGLDGIQWEFKIEWRYRRLNIHGSNCYPESDGSPSESSDYSRSFRRFMKALGHLAGDRRIG